MGEFFHGWRRKLGVVTFLVAWVFAVGWVRSDAVVDTILISVGTWRTVFVAGSQQFQVIFQRERPLSIFILEEYEGQTVVGLLEINQESFENGSINQSSRIGRLHRIEHDDQQFTLIPYWAVVVPLTLLSGYLLLWPGKRSERQTKAPVEGK